MNKQIVALVLVAGLVLAGFLAYAQDASNPIQESINKGMGFLQAQDGLDISEALILVGILNYEHPELGIKEWVLEKEPLLDEKHTFWHAWLKGESVDLDGLSDFEQELTFNLDLARALQCENVSLKKIQEISNWEDDSAQEFGSYNNEQSFLISYFYTHCEGSEAFEPILTASLSKTIEDIQNEEEPQSLTEKLLHYCLIGISGELLTTEQVDEILSLQQENGGWMSLTDTSRSNTYPYPTSLAVCALIKYQDNQGQPVMGPENEDNSTPLNVEVNNEEIEPTNEGDARE